MSDLPVAEPSAVPCPRCEYDLRMQQTAACPECGMQFPSMSAMLIASQSAHRVFKRVMKWRQRLAIFTLCVLLSFFALIALNANSRRIQPYYFYAVMWLWVLSGVFAFVLMIQVIRWRFSSQIPKWQRVELNQSIPWLLFLSAPLFVFVAVMIVMLL